MERKSLTKDGTKLSNKTRIIVLERTILKIKFSRRLSGITSVALVFLRMSETKKSKDMHIVILVTLLLPSVI